MKNGELCLFLSKQLVSFLLVSDLRENKHVKLSAAAGTFICSTSYLQSSWNGPQITVQHTRSGFRQTIRAFTRTSMTRCIRRYRAQEQMARVQVERRMLGNLISHYACLTQTKMSETQKVLHCRQYDTDSSLSIQKQKKRCFSSLFLSCFSEQISKHS